MWGRCRNDWWITLLPCFVRGFWTISLHSFRSYKMRANPDFVVEVVSLVFDDSDRIINNMTRALEQQVADFKQIDANVHQFKGSSSRCLMCLQQVRYEYSLFKNNIRNLFRLEQQILAAGGTIPMRE